MRIEPDELAHLPLDTFGPNACTPRVDDPAWRGIVLRAPSRVVLEDGERAIVPVCGYAMLDVPPQPGPPMTLHALTGSGEHFFGPIGRRDGNPEIPPPKMAAFDPSQLAGLAAAAFFTCDAIAICALGAPTGTLTVWAELGAARSNDAQVVIERA
jgi:hypothetical protein